MRGYWDYVCGWIAGFLDTFKFCVDTASVLSV